MKTRYFVGSYRLGFRNTRLFIDTSTANGHVDLSPLDDGTTEVCVGIDCPWSESLSVLLHELYEGTLVDLNTRYKRKPSYSEESSDFIFVMSHNELGEAHERIGTFLAEINIFCDCYAADCNWS